MSTSTCPHGIRIGVACGDCEFAIALASCRAVLLKLKMMSEVGAQHIDQGGTTARRMANRLSAEQAHPQPLAKPLHSADSAPPRGVAEDENITGRERAPSKQLSLHAHYLWLMQKAQREKRTVRLLELARLALSDYESLMDPQGSRESVEDSVKRLLTDYQGHSCEVASAGMAVEGVPRRDIRLWVRKQRILAGMNPDDGTYQEHDPKLAAAVRMSKAGATQKAIAGELGVSQPRVAAMLAGKS